MKLITDLGTRVTGTKGRKERFGLYECDNCHIHFEANTKMAKKRNQKHCSKCRNTTHGLSKEPLFSVLTGMISRCHNEVDKDYARYGANGIYVCSEWKENPASFVEWGKDNVYEKGLTIDRINNYLGYEPSNCRFVSLEIQARNTKSLMATNKSGYRGVSKSKDKYRARIDVDGKKISLGSYATAYEAHVAYKEYVDSNNLEHNYKD